MSRFNGFSVSEAFATCNGHTSGFDSGSNMDGSHVVAICEWYITGNGVCFRMDCLGYIFCSIGRYRYGHGNEYESRACHIRNGTFCFFTAVVTKLWSAHSFSCTFNLSTVGLRGLPSFNWHAISEQNSVCSAVCIDVLYLCNIIWGSPILLSPLD